MDLAILFWFYKKPAICENRLRLLKKYNSELKIFGLFGGDKKEERKYKDRLGKYLDDFYTSPFEDPDWKWVNGDLMLLDWYEKRGKSLNWDSIVVIQWDTLVFDSLLDQFSGIKKGEIFLSGLRTLNEDIELSWHWTRPDRSERKNYLKFLKYVREKCNYTEKPLCCVFILQTFPRIFFEKYLGVKNKEIGMLEYKVPIYAKIFKIPFFEKDFGVWWMDRKENIAMNAMAWEIGEDYIKEQLKKKDGWRIFHPYCKIWKLGK